MEIMDEIESKKMKRRQYNLEYKIKNYHQIREYRKEYDEKNREKLREHLRNSYYRRKEKERKQKEEYKNLKLQMETLKSVLIS